MKDAFYEKLQEGTSRVAKHDVLICVGDFHAIFNNSKEGFESCMGRMGVESRMNENGVGFGSFCLENDLLIGGVLFQHFDMHKKTWLSPPGKYKYQI